MRVRSGFGWLGCFALAAACGGNTLGSGVDTLDEETGGSRSVIPLPGDGGRPDGTEPSGAAGEDELGSATGGAPNAGAPNAGGASPRGGSEGGGSPAPGGVPGGAPLGGAAAGPPAVAGFGGGRPIVGGAPGVAGSGASAGTGVLRSVPVPLPEPAVLDECTYSVDCQDGGSSCTCDYQCPLDSVFAYCYEDTEREPDGTWSCTYSASGRAGSYRVGGVDMATACQVVADLAGGEPEFAGPESCAPERRVRSEDTCDYTDLCTRPILLADGRMASLGWPRYIGCSEYGDLCLVGNVAYRVEDIELADRCEALLPYADDPPVPVFEDPPVCETTIIEEISGACQTDRLCSEIAEVAPSVSIEHQEIFYAACESDGRGGSRCACSRDGEALRFDTPWPTNDATACDVARGACEGEFEFTGEVECRQRYISVDTLSCQTMADCVRPGSLAGAEVVAIAILEASCLHDGDAYACSCVSGNHAEQIPVEAPSSFDGCARAAEACRDAVELSFVGDNGSISAP
jgi:hypothetical protein